MKIDLSILQNNFKLENVNQNSDTKFDLHLSAQKLGTAENTNELITSKSLCTPGCGHTGTGNSYCCSC